MTTLLEFQLNVAVFITFGVIILALIIAGAIFSARATRKRREALEAWAKSEGHTYRGEYREPGLVLRYAGRFDHVSRGETSKFYADNIIEGKAGWPFVMFDNHWQTTSTDNKGRRQTHDHSKTVCIMTLGINLGGEIKVRPENLFDKIAGAVGFDDIDFESEEFSRKFHVKSRDKKFAYDVITQSTMDYLLKFERISFELDGDAICVAMTNGTAAAQFWPGYVAAARGVLERLPQYLLDDRKSRSA